MVGEERSKPTLRIFPIGSYSSETAFRNFFPRKESRTDEEQAQHAFIKEMEIIHKYYETTFKCSALMSEVTAKAHPSLRVNLIRIGMNFMHHAARIEAKTKKMQLPHVSEDQLIKYLANPELFDMDISTRKVTKVYYEPILDRFHAQEQGLHHVMSRELGHESSYESFDVGCAQMWDFLKTAPTLV